jgi:hypothetical protein
MNNSFDYFAMHVGILYFEMHAAILGTAFKTRNRSESCPPFPAGNLSSRSETADFVCSREMLMRQLPNRIAPLPLTELAS